MPGMQALSKTFCPRKPIIQTLRQKVLMQILKKIAKWAEAWFIKFNPLKTEMFLISRKINKPVHPSLIMLGQQIKEVEFHKNLGIYFSNDASWHKHID